MTSHSFLLNLFSSPQLHFTSSQAALPEGGAASSVLMQTGLFECKTNPAVSDSTGVTPNGLAIDSFGNLYVSEYFNNRVMMYQGAAFSNFSGMAASFVWGQPDFNSSVNGTAPNQLFNPVRVFFDEQRKVLWVADSGNHRVLGFATYSSNPSPSTNLQISFQGVTPAVILFPEGRFLGYSVLCLMTQVLKTTMAPFIL